MLSKERHFSFEQARYQRVTSGLFERKMPTYADYGGWVISIIAGWGEVIADRQSHGYPHTITFSWLIPMCFHKQQYVALCCSFSRFSWPFRLFLASTLDRFFALFWPKSPGLFIALQTALEAVSRGKACRSRLPLSAWQRVRDSNPCTGLERAVS